MKMKETVVKLNAIRDKMHKDGKVAILEGFKEFFNNHPEAKEIVWTQYTPYFNDGDVCTFSMNPMELRVDIKCLEKDVLYKLLSKYNSKQYSILNSKLEVAKESGNKEIIKKYEDEIHNLYETDTDYTYGEMCVSNVLERIGRKLSNEEKSLLDDFNELQKCCYSLSEFMESMLGNHIFVRVTKDGITTEQFDHD